MTVLPVDMLAVASYGLDRWTDNRTWPVSPAEIRTLGIAKFRALARAADSVESSWADCIWSNLRYGDYLVQRILAIAVSQRTRQQNVDIDARGDGISIYKPDYDQVAAAFRAQMRPVPRRGISVRNARRRWLGNAHLPVAQRLGSVAISPNVWNLGARNILKEAYLSREAPGCDFPNPGDWPRSSAMTAVPASVHRALDEAMTELLAVIPGMQCSMEDRRGLIDLWSAQLSEVRGVYDDANRRVPKPRVLLWGSQGNVMFRTVVHAMKRRGARIVGFQHGHSPGWVQHPHIAPVEIHGCDEFVCGTPGLRDAHRRLIEQSGIADLAHTKVTSADIDLYDRWRTQRRPRSRSIKRVLMPGYPGVARAYTYDWTGLALMRVPLEIDVARALRRAGYQVVYKPHPETASAMSELMRPYVDQVAVGGFEKVVETVDAAVYLYPFSTTFPYVLLQDLPVLLVDVHGMDWLPEIIAPLRKRCAVVTASLTPHNRIIIDETEIVDGMAAAATLTDETFTNNLFTLSRV